MQELHDNIETMILLIPQSISNSPHVATMGLLVWILHGLTS